MAAVPLLLITHDDALWDHWRRLDTTRWMPARGTSLADVARWREQGRQMVVLDTGLPRLPAWTDGAIRPWVEGLKVLAADTRPGDEAAKQAVLAGASGYAHAYVPVEALDRILQHVQAGEIWLGRGLVTRMLLEIDKRMQQTPRGQDWAQSLTQREKDVAARASMGDANQAIADALGITERTVRAHLSAVFEKLGVTDRLQLALKVHGIQ